jgi:hypothetical protein
MRGETGRGPPPVGERAPDAVAASRGNADNKAGWNTGIIERNPAILQAQSDEALRGSIRFWTRSGRAAAR